MPIEIKKEPMDVDVLIVGGGIAGLMASINAADHGIRVVVSEKANTKRSGCGATGNDHFGCYIPEVHGDDITPILREHENSQVGGYADSLLSRRFLEESFERVKDWDRWGISMRPTGDWEFTGHGFPGRPRLALKYAGYNQKAVLTEQAKKRGVQIENHLTITDVISDGKEIVGAIGISVTHERPLIRLFRAKSIVLATGCGSRLYPAPSPGYMFNTANCPVCTGGGQAMAYRAGAKLVNLEFPHRHAGPKYFARCGKASWIGIYKDPRGKAVGPFVTKATKEYGDITGDVWSAVFTDMHKSGKGPVYMDCSETSEDDIKYMLWGLKHEGGTAMLNHMEEKGIDVRQHMVEFTEYEPFLVGRGIEIDINAETSIKGLYAAGDPVGNFRADIAGAATFGWIAGENAAERAKSVSEFNDFPDSRMLEQRTELYSKIIARDWGPSWKEANLALQQIMNDYAGLNVRSKTLLAAGLKYLDDLKEETLSTLAADNSHTLMRSLEVLDLMECGRLIFLTALERKESRALHKRSDFPFMNPLLNDKFLNIWQEDGETRLAWRDKK